MKPNALTLPTLIKKVSLPVALLAISIAGTGAAKADTTIFSDTFETSGATDISGTKPTEHTGMNVDVPGSSYVVGGGSFNTTSTGAVPTGGFAPIAELAFPDVTSNSGVYTLTAEVDLYSGNNGSNDAEIGFDDTSTGHVYINSPSGPILAVNDGGSSAFSSKSDLGNSLYSNNRSLATTGDNTLQLVLNTDSTYWTISAYVNGSADGTYTYTSSDPNPSINEIFIGSQGTLDVEYTGLTLTQSTAPEPTTWALMGAGLVSLVFLFRLLRRRNS